MNIQNVRKLLVEKHGRTEDNIRSIFPGTDPNASDEDVAREIDRVLTDFEAEIQARDTILKGDNGWITNAEYLLGRCPHTIRMCEGGGPEDLLWSLILTFMKMEILLEKKNGKA
jgi:hypothetical protein